MFSFKRCVFFSSVGFRCKKKKNWQNSRVRIKQHVSLTGIYIITTLAMKKFWRTLAADI